MENVDNGQEQMTKVSREMETLKKNQKEVLEIKYTVTEMKHIFDELISSWAWLRKESVGLKKHQQKLSVLRSKGRRKRNGSEYPRTMGRLIKDNIHVRGLPEEILKKGKTRNILSNNGG